MKLKINNIKILIETEFFGRQSNLVKTLNIDYSYFNQIMNNHKSPSSKKICEKIIEYCKKHNIDFKKYIKF